MKRSTKRINEHFPEFEGKLKANKNNVLIEESMKGLNEVEVTFLKLACFFENPEHEKFDIGLLYQHLDNDWLELALELIAQFFKEDTYLIQMPALSFVRKDSKGFFNQKQFADFLAENELNYDRRKLNVYFSRGKLPNPDLELGGTPYWSQTSVEKFCEEEKKRLKK
ncbi:hypothetical protein WQ54_14465 [Bacillus sp. SA1-12]|uniref:hypothetical protein n=1 Tax=Bacillus sp. SA1-12 TaxID=1455638 RepID=UPI0006257E9E|nr:hypothetical protein [Bacillus sp. SA1-12]KKI91473.1 hypothetical protein WQ54_14465 [Bacillus sp. SA1-12]